MNFWTVFYLDSSLLYSHTQTQRFKRKIFENKTSSKKDFFYITIAINPVINIYELEKLCDLVGWGRRLPSKVEFALNNSFLVTSLYVETSKEMQLIGFVRAISDQTFNATIWDMVVHPRYQKQGLGSFLMHQMIQELRYREIETVTLFADAQGINFYSRLGFAIDPATTKGMFWYPQ